VSVETELKPVSNLSPIETSELGELTAAACPDRASGHPESDREWREPMWEVLVRAEGRLVSHTGVLLVDGTVDGEPWTIGGIGGVATHPDLRGRGYGSLGLARALDFLLGEGAGFAMVIGPRELLGFYSALGWSRFGGTVVNRQFGAREVFEIDEVMVGDLRETAPAAGTIDLGRPAW
jgi:aminoglycoside 2'-N-acetyltransferase I